jgi:putative cell wall-binding protein
VVCTYIVIMVVGRHIAADNQSSVIIIVKNTMADAAILAK